MTGSHRYSYGRLLIWLNVVLFAAVMVITGPGCAYFNTFYNAKRLYSEADETPRGRDDEVTRVAKEKYEESIKKCETLITDYPKSKYVDDAILLIGKCFYEIEQYDEAIIKFGELKDNFPDSKLNSEGQLYTAKSYVGKQNDEMAVGILLELVGEKSTGKLSDEVLFLLGTSMMKVGRDDEAVEYLAALARRYPRSPRRVSADLEAAKLYAARGEYDKSLEIYEGLRPLRLSEKDKIRCLKSMGEVLVEKGDYKEAMKVFDELNAFALDQLDRASVMLLVGQTFAGLDSVNSAIGVLKDVTTSYPRSMFSAEAHFRLGEIYQEKLDSLQVAQAQYDRVGQQYANSEYAGEALKRSISISKYIRLQESIAAGGEEESAAIQFDLAEIQLFQFDDYEKALAGYRKVVDEFPDDDLAPRAAYAIAFIYDDRLDDAEKAREAYQYLLTRYPESQQAEHARASLTTLDDEVQQ